MNMDSFLALWESSDFKKFIVATIVVVLMVVYYYMVIKENKNDSDVGDAMATLDKHKLVKWIIMAIFMILAIVYQINHS